MDFAGTLQTYEPGIRLGVFLTVFVLIAVIEFILPRRKRVFTRLQRWPRNIGLNVFANLIIRFGAPLVAIDAAIAASAKGWGLLNLVALPGLIELLIAVVVLDLLIYWQHVIFHWVPVFWRLHQVHHTDRDFDTTTALRFHPIEILLSLAIKIGAIYLLGPSAAAVILFEIILNGMALFNHGNIRLGSKFDQILRWFVVTPDMHRVHHSVVPAEYNRNFGFNLSCWDRIFGSYTQDAEAGQEGMTIGQDAHLSEESKGLLFMLLLPFKPTK